MVSVEDAQSMALSLPETLAGSHFHIADFRVNNKIFATIREAEGLMMVQLTPHEQSVFCAFNPAVVYPVPGGWGLKGATFFVLKKVRKTMLADALTVAWKNKAGSKRVQKYFPEK
ncbi:MAG: MmcQ/YjbR family DNA-binding protein [Dinghuibacter sp.]|nr:MmcQ/YjbR family DNA-binding protein [Dinghuibacter sp.]